jgi:hypothetical protein
MMGILLVALSVQLVINKVNNEEIPSFSSSVTWRANHGMKLLGITKQHKCSRPPLLWRARMNPKAWDEVPVDWFFAAGYSIALTV